MSVFHYPLCPLIFEHRTEVEYHLRHDHRSRSDERAALANEIALVDEKLDSERLRALQSSRSGVAVTILMGTTPGATMTNVDVARLGHLAQQARSRLAAESRAVPPNLEERLNSVVAAAERAPTEEGLAILVSAQELAIFHLPFGPSNRVVIDRSFATRDLETTLQCYPRYRVAVLGRHLRLLEGRGQNLGEVKHVPSEDDPTRGERFRQGADERRARWGFRPSNRIAGVEAIDDLLTYRVRSDGDLPLVVAGNRWWRSTFAKRSRYAASVIGEVSRTYDGHPRRLAQAAQPFLADRLRDEQAVALAELDRAESQGVLAWGIQRAWAAVVDGAADLLWVEQGFARPARVGPSSVGLELVDEANEPGVIDDIVDDMIEAARGAGTGVYLLSDGVLDRSEPVAVSLRPPTRDDSAMATSS